MLAIYTGRGVAPEVNLREHISHTPLQSSNKAEPTLAFKPRGDITRSPKQGYQWPQNGHVSKKKFKEKKKLSLLLMKWQYFTIKTRKQPRTFLAFTFVFCCSVQMQEMDHAIGIVKYIAGVKKKTHYSGRSNGVLGTRTINWSNFFQFHAVFSKKLCKIMGWLPSLWEILALVLIYTGRIQCEVLTTLPFCFSWIKKFLGQHSKI